MVKTVGGKGVEEGMVEATCENMDKRAWFLLS